MHKFYCKEQLILTNVHNIWSWQQGFIECKKLGGGGGLGAAFLQFKH